MKGYYILSGLQEILVRKLARKYTTPNFRVSVRKNNKLEKGFYTGGDRFSIEWQGNNLHDELSFRKELRENKLTECLYTL